MRDFLKRLVLVCLISVLGVAGCAHVSFADGTADMEAYFTQPEEYSGMMTVPGKGEMRYYAQNDPLWRDLTYEKEGVSSNRPFRDSACSPTAMAMAIVSLVPDEELSVIRNYAKRDYAPCSCSVNKYRCTHSHARYVLTSQRDYVRFLPIVLADFATGNNTMGVVSRNTAPGTGSGYLEKVAEVYGLSISFVSRYSEVRELMEKDNVAVVGLAGRNGAFTTVGHYVFLAGQDDEAMYIMDPLYRSNYADFKYGYKLKVIRPGLVMLRHEQFTAANFSYFIVLEKKPTDKAAK